MTLFVIPGTKLRGTAVFCEGEDLRSLTTLGTNNGWWVVLASHDENRLVARTSVSSLLAAAPESIERSAMVRASLR